MKKIAIFTTLQNFDKSYSLSTVIQHQARILKKYSGMEVEIWVLENCKDDFDEDLRDNVKKIVPVFTWDTERVNDSMIPRIQNVIQDGINSGVKYFFCHDILLVRSYITYNEAVRRIAGINPGVKWYFWMHSGPHQRPSVLNDRIEYLEHTLPYNSKLVYLNYFDLQKAANMYNGVTTDKCYVVYNPVTNIDNSKIDNELAIDIANSINYRDAVVRCVYPFSSTRIAPKQVNIVLEILNIVKSKGISVKFIGCNCHANALNEKVAITDLIKKYTSKPFCLSREDLLFTSQYKPPMYEYSIPNSTVIDLFKMSNLFIFPSISEVCPIILQEASLTNNLIIANADFPSLAEITGNNGALFYHFGSTYHDVRYGINNTFNERMDYFKWIAENILNELHRGFYQSHAMNNIIKNYSYEAIWNKQLRNLIE